MAFCSICTGHKQLHSVLHAPTQLPEVGQRVSGCHACTDCAIQLHQTSGVCPFCREALIPQSYGDVNTDGQRVCGHVFVERRSEGLVARFCASHLGSEDNDHCRFHGPHQRVPEAEPMQSNDLVEQAVDQFTRTVQINDAGVEIAEALEVHLGLQTVREEELQRVEQAFSRVRHPQNSAEVRQRRSDALRASFTRLTGRAPTANDTMSRYL